MPEPLNTRSTRSSNFIGINEGEDVDDSIGQHRRSSRSVGTRVSMIPAERRRAQGQRGHRISVESMKAKHSMIRWTHRRSSGSVKSRARIPMMTLEVVEGAEDEGIDGSDGARR
jgi:hypothetical protein